MSNWRTRVIVIVLLLTLVPRLETGSSPGPDGLPAARLAPLQAATSARTDAPPLLGGLAPPGSLVLSPPPFDQAPSGAPPCASAAGGTCQATGAVQGASTKLGSMQFELAATGPPNTLAQTTPVLFLLTTAGTETFTTACSAVPATAPFTTICVGATVGDILQGNSVVIRFLTTGGPVDLSGSFGAFANNPCTSVAGGVCSVVGAVQGTWTRSGSGVLQVSALPPSDATLNGPIPVVVVPTTAGTESFPCTVPTNLTTPVTCTAATVGEVRQAAIIVVAFSAGSGTHSLFGTAVNPQPTPFPSLTPIPTRPPLTTATPTATPVDHTPPTISSFSINGNAGQTLSTTVRLNVVAADNVAVTEVSFSNDGSTWGPWQPYNPLQSWQLASGPGLKTVSARVRDAAGNVSASATATILLAIVGSNPGLSVAGGALFTNSATVNLLVSAPGTTTQVYIGDTPDLNAATPIAPTPNTLHTLSNFQSSTQPRIVYLWFKDTGGAPDPPLTPTATPTGPYSDYIVGDKDPPVGTVSFGGLVPGTNLTRLDVSGSDTVSGVQAVRVSTQPLTNDLSPSFQPVTTPIALDLRGVDTVYQQLQDRAGNVSAATAVKEPAVALDTLALQVGLAAPAVLNATVSLPLEFGVNASLAMYDTGSRDGAYVSNTLKTVQLGAGGTGLASIVLENTVPSGQYELRLYAGTKVDVAPVAKSATFSVSASVGPTRTATATPTPASSPTCPGPRVTVSPAGSGRLQVVVVAGSGVLGQLSVVSDPHVPNPNALLDLPDGRTGVGGAMSLQPAAAQYSLYLRPANTSQAVTLPLQIVDGCGTMWATFVGGGVTAFAGGAAPPEQAPVTRLQAQPTPTATASPTPLPPRSAR